ncbi:MAG TPA: hypothetical protein VM934_18060 [Pyrinomonadaceae bacterium]|jgi:hypothetical protein|nr:hypothetical protein [Pyrinomonadaceae bacterium]
MARGWESKSVEAQMEDAGERERERAALQVLSPAERVRLERLESLKMSRARTLEQMERADRPAHREMLKRTLLALEKEMNELG